jgi:hypothetical protein
VKFLSLHMYVSIFLLSLLSQQAAAKFTVLDENSRVISNNPSRSTGFIPLGTAVQNDQPLEKKFTIRNDGPDTLTIRTIQNSLRDNLNQIEIVLSGKLSTLPATLPPGESETFAVRSIPNSNWMQMGNITIQTNDSVVAASLPSQGSEIRGLRFQNNGNPLLTIKGSAQTTYVIECIDAFGAQNWRNVGTVTTDSNGSAVFEDALGTGANRFYRTKISDSSTQSGFNFNVAAAVGTPTLMCPGDSNNFVEAGFTCAGKTNGTICGASVSGKTKVCNHDSCVLLGDLNHDDEVDFLDLDPFMNEISNSRTDLAANFSCDGKFQNPIAETQGFADALAARSTAEYNTVVRGLCGGAALLATRGKALVFVNGPLDFDAMRASAGAGGITPETPPIYRKPTEVCVDNLGVYDPETGALTGGNDGFLNGKYARTDVLAINFGDDMPTRLFSSENDFRVNYLGDSKTPIRKAIISSSEVQMYFDVNNYRSTIFNDRFIRSLGLSPEIEKNLVTRQFRGDLEIPDIGPTNTKAVPILEAEEATNPAGIELFPLDNGARASIRNKLVPTNFSASIPFDTEALVGDYAGLMGFWALGSNKGFPSDAFYGGDENWQHNVLSPLSNALSAWVGFRYTGNHEVYRYMDYALRMWSGRICGGTNIPCDKGHNIRNVMMFDEQNTSKDGVFPFSTPAGITNMDGPVASDLAALFIAAVFYDVAFEAGLGVEKTDKIIWKTISLIQDNIEFPMRALGRAIQDATHALWPSGIYDQDIADVLTSRGIPVNGVDDFRKNLPTAIGPTVKNTDLSSTHPNNQPSQYGKYQRFTDEYVLDGVPTDYIAYTFYKYSKYGPCDYVELQKADGSYSNGSPNPDGTPVWRGTDRSIGNKTIFVPSVSGKPNAVRVVSFRKRCDSEADGFYAEDVKPFGFRIIKATPNGFSFTATLKSESPTTLTYTVSIVDPSVTKLGSAEYTWFITPRGQAIRSATGSEIEMTLEKNQPVSIKIERLRAGQKNILEVEERSNDLDREDGNAFVGP